ncbi:hypothetical protein ACTFIR_012807 [Dictyostelium discoideum]
MKQTFSDSFTIRSKQTKKVFGLYCLLATKLGLSTDEEVLEKKIKSNTDLNCDEPAREQFIEDYEKLNQIQTLMVVLRVAQKIQRRFSHSCATKGKSRLVQFVKSLSSFHGIFACLGNNDYEDSKPCLKSGVILLENEFQDLFLD